MFLQTERLILREFCASDFEDVHAYASDYENVKHMMFGPNTPEQTHDYLERQCVEEMLAEPRMHYNIALEEKSSGTVIGGISFHMNWRRDDAILGGIMNRNFAGKGYMTEGLRGVMEIAFSQLKLHRIHAVCDVDNIAMLRVIERVGMRNEGRMVKRGKARPEAAEPYFDQFGLAILREEWLANQQGNHSES